MDPYEEKETGGIMKQLCMAVPYVHRREVVHCDLKVRVLDVLGVQRISLLVRN
jgi:serine/threonine protein kinase